MALRLTRPIEIPPIPTTTLTPTLSELYDLPSDFFPSSSSSTSSLRSALLATSRQLQHTPSTQVSNSYIVPRTVLEGLEGGGEEELNELVWQGTRLEWKVRNERMMREWDYSELGETIAFARFVQFEEEEQEPITSQESSAGGGATTTTSTIWGPYRDRTAQETGKTNEWSDEVLKLPTEPPFPSPSTSSPASSSSSTASRPLRTHLLIVLSTLAFLHPISRPTTTSNPETRAEGGGIPIHLPFKVASIHPLQSGGVLFERAREGREALPGYDAEREEEERERVPIWWSLSSKTGGYGELKPVLVSTSKGSSSEAAVEGGEGREEEGKGTMRDLNEKLVFVSNDFDPQRKPGTGTDLRVGVSVNETRGKVTVWRYDKIVVSTKEEDPIVEEEEGKSQADESITLDLSPKTSRTTRQTGRRRGGPRTSNQSELELSHYNNNLDSNKSLPLGSIMRGGGSYSTSTGRRRSARLSSSHHHAHTLETSLSSTTTNDLLSNALTGQHPLPPLTPHDASTNRPSLRRTHTHTQQTDPTLSPENRRTSLTRNDLSVTMDRMALSQGSSVGGAGAGPMLIHTGLLQHGGAGGETLMDREATVYLGEEEWVDRINGRRRERGEEAASEWETTKVWDGELDGTSAQGMQVDLFDQRSPTTATLSILLPAASTLLLLSLSLDSTSNELTCTPIKQISAKDACTVSATRQNKIQDLLVLKPSKEFGLISSKGMELEVEGSTIGGGNLEKIESNGGRRIVLARTGRKRSLTSIRIGIEANGLGQKVLETLAQVLGEEEFEQIFKTVLGRSVGENGFRRVRESLEGMFGIESRGESRPQSNNGADSAFFSRLRKPSPSASTASSAPPTVNFQSSHFAILLSLHLLVQSLRLRVSTTEEAQELAKIVAGLAKVVGAEGWMDEYRRTWGPEIAGFSQPSTTASSSAIPSGLLPKYPPNILVHLFNLLSCPALPDSTSFSLSSVAQLFSSDTPSSYYGSLSSPLSQLSSLIEIFSLLAPSSASTPIQRAHQAVFRFHELGYTVETLEDLPFGISVPIREAMRTCQLDPPEATANEGKEWDGFWNLVGRRELERYPLAYRGRGKTKRMEEAISSVDIDALVQQIESRLSTSEANKKIVSSETREEKPDLNPVPRAARFNEDKRMEEVSRMLQYVEPVVIAPGEKTLDQLTPQVQQSILSALSHRTFALPVGAAMFQLASIQQSSSDSLKIPKINTSARIVPMSSPVPFIEKERDPAIVTIPERSEWPDFHSGVAAALRLKLEGGKPVDSSQISFNRPAELDARHAGLLLGLGLNGQLGSMLSSQAYDYLKAKHDPTSVAILLGLAVTFLGTSDPTVTSVISIHLPALHPPRSSSLNVSGMTKSAAAVALGLLHFGTGRRSLADVLVREMCGVKITNVEDALACREAYALSCGFAFGFIMLAQGGKLGTSTSSNEVDLLRVFRALILGENNRPLPGAFFPSSSSSSSSDAPIDVNITSTAATVGLALMFLRTERQDVANIFEIPDSPRRLDYVRSDVLLLRSLSQGLVMWNSITPSKEWIESGLPKFLADVDLNKPMDSDWEVARWSVIAGACFAVGFKYAGTATAEAHATLIHYMDRLTRACYVKATTVQSKIKRHSLRACLGVVSISLAMVMAGTGELNVLRRLRVAHGHFSEGLTFGYHLSTHMALGLLFLGEAKYTLSNTNGAIATLLLALYPVFPSTSTDNRAHLQAYRHLWVLAAEPRYLEARDIDSKEPVFLPVRLRLVDSTAKNDKVEVKAKQLVAPTLIPDVRLLDSIQVESPRYWGFNVRLNSNSNQFARFLRDSTLYVKRRTGHLSYAQDPRGIRSIFTRSKSETGSVVYDFGETTRMLNPSASGLRDFVAAFSDDAEAISATEQLCIPPDANRLPSQFEAFCASVLLECLTKDKRDIASGYHSMYHAHSLLSPSLTPSTETLFAAEQLRLVVDFYKRGTYKALFGKPTSSKSKSPSSSSSSSREPLLNPAFIDHVSSILSSRIEAITSSSSFADSLSTYLSSLGSWPSSPNSTIPLALQLAHQSVPDLSALSQLRNLVQEAKREGMRDEEVEMLLRCTAETIKSGGKKAWSKEVSRLLSRI